MKFPPTSLFFFLSLSLLSKRGKYRGWQTLVTYSWESECDSRSFFFCLTRKSGVAVRITDGKSKWERKRERWIIRWENINEARPFVYKVELNLWSDFFTGWASKFERVARWREIFFLVLGHFGPRQKESPRKNPREGVEFFQGMELNESRRTSSFESILALAFLREKEREENGRVTRIFLLLLRERERERKRKNTLIATTRKAEQPWSSFGQIKIFVSLRNDCQPILRIITFNLSIKFSSYFAFQNSYMYSFSF